MVEKTGTPRDRQPDEWQHDLNPDPMAGQNHGIISAHPERTELSAVSWVYNGEGEIRTPVELPQT